MKILWCMGVYSSKERADQRVEELRKADPSFPYYYCNEYTLDEDCIMKELNLNCT